MKNTDPRQKSIYKVLLAITGRRLAPVAAHYVRCHLMVDFCMGCGGQLNTLPEANQWTPCIPGLLIVRLHTNQAHTLFSGVFGAGRYGILFHTRQAQLDQHWLWAFGEDAAITF